ncbi:type III-B CRISPR module RAMP protein Cmr4 [Thiospirillum jenense]|uniref:Type III-B CRISPR module RAMP protein Cmr4 n=1 Tax=Thiospirillum jenense TaxID=1653858 RepID=A0A839HEC8_9GAMM|nr:type III-B CRISPR module RAMP protein Cmr4 [Thiospirillum jenense]MBB1125588.1 type III-B CRISPR module RAMP protein Cmr4 [Thiospirillum jenense]
MQPRLFHLHTLSALHCGTGQSVGVVDLPIARARATQLPIVPGSSLRGVLRQDITATNEPLAKQLFGPKNPKTNDESFAGALTVGDAHLLIMPIRALAGITCYVTAPFILDRYARDLASVGIKTPAVPRAVKAENALVALESVNVTADTLVLEDLDLKVERNAQVRAWAELIAALVHTCDASGQTDFVNRFAILPDNILGYLSETATELRTRITIDEQTGTVKQGALWFEEHLPAEAVLWGIYAVSDSNERQQQRDAADLVSDLRTALALDRGALLQLGGQAGVGRGLVRLLAWEDLA